MTDRHTDRQTDTHRDTDTERARTVLLWSGSRQETVRLCKGGALQGLPDTGRGQVPSR